ncbi:MAG: xanthine dehydrogenase family protein molybdopterin-binding subunit [Chloroflexi bacterium]|nr:xanthine dehydrogenase family protein molybdopterin-binding subunit [Chloroflexota bacterium]
MVDIASRPPVIGTDYPKVDGIDKVTGRARYGADIHLPGMLHGKILRSPHAHARILSIDTSTAEALDGVGAVVTGADFPLLAPGTMVPVGAMRLDLYRISRLVMARDKVLFEGHPVAAVAATTPEIASHALDLIKVEYEALPHVLDEVLAMAADAPILHDDLFTSGLGEETPVDPSNVALHLEMGRGDVDAGFADADVVVEHSFKTESVHQGYIEPEAETAWWRPDRITVWADTQGIFGLRAQLASFLGVPLNFIKIIPMEVGGGFGAKSALRIAPLSARLSKKSGRPVRTVLSRDEVLRATGPGVKTTTAVKVGATNDGVITAIDARMVYNAGAFPGSPLAGGTLVGFSPYQTENLRIIGYDVVTNRPKGAAYRAPGGPPITFAVESVMDEIAEKIGMGKIEFRQKNASKTGDRGPNDLPFNRIGLETVLDSVKAHSAWTSDLPAPRSGGKVGRGLGLGYWRGGTNTSSCSLSVQGDGSISVVIGSVDLSGARTAFAQITADEFEIPAATVHVEMGDTDTVGYTDGSGGSRVTYVTGAAVHNACRSAIEILRVRAADTLEVTPDVVDYQQGTFTARDIPDREISLSDLASASVRGAGVITTTGTATGMEPAPAFTAHVADVEVDEDTGKVQVLNYTVFEDVGKAINRAGVEGQIQGGVAQGIGWALHEAYVYDDKGRMTNASLLDYRMPTALDLPRIQTELIEVPATDGPYGVRGVGEVPIVPPAGTLANAIYDAIGVRMDRLPMSPENVFTVSRAPKRGDWLSMDFKPGEAANTVVGVDIPNDE